MSSKRGESLLGLANREEFICTAIVVSDGANSKILSHSDSASHHTFYMEAGKSYLLSLSPGYSYDPNLTYFVTLTKLETTGEASFAITKLNGEAPDASYGNLIPAPNECEVELTATIPLWRLVAPNEDGNHEVTSSVTLLLNNAIEEKIGTSSVSIGGNALVPSSAGDGGQYSISLQQDSWGGSDEAGYRTELTYSLDEDTLTSAFDDDPNQLVKIVIPLKNPPSYASYIGEDSYGAPFWEGPYVEDESELSLSGYEYILDYQDVVSHDEVRKGILIVQEAMSFFVAVKDADGMLVDVSEDEPGAITLTAHDGTAEPIRGYRAWSGEYDSDGTESHLEGFELYFSNAYQNSSVSGEDCLYVFPEVPLGDYTLTYRTKDAAGNDATYTRELTFSQSASAVSDLSELRCCSSPRAPRSTTPARWAGSTAVRRRW